MDSPPRFLRFVAHLACLATTSALGCASSVTPSDGSAPTDTASQSDTASQPDTRASMCPPQLPQGSVACSTEGARCDYTGFTCYNDPYTIPCFCFRAAPNLPLSWSCQLCEGPLQPPNLPV